MNMDKKTVIIQDRKECYVGVTTRAYTKDGEKFFDVLLETGSKLYGLTTNNTKFPHIRTITNKISATITPDADAFDETDTEIDIKFED